MAIDRSLSFTIIMPAYNVDAYIEDAIHDVLEQSWSNWNLIIVDDCSTDQTGMIVDAYAEADSRIHVIHHDVNKGLPAARNSGLREAKGDYVLFLDPDDRYDLDLLATVADAVHKLPADLVVYSLEEDYYDTKGNIEWYQPHYVDTAFYDCRKTWPVSVGEKKHPNGYGDSVDDADITDTPGSASAKQATNFGNDSVSQDGQRRQMTKAQIGALGLDARHNLEIGHQPGYSTDPDAMHEAVAELEGETMLGYAWNKAYRLDYLRKYKLAFPEYTHIEDIMFNLSVCENMTSLVVLENILYGYRNQKQKRLTGKYLPDYLQLQKTRIQAFLDQQERWDILDDAVLARTSAFYYRSYFSAIEREIAHKSPKEEIRRMAEEEQQSSLNRLLKNYLPDDSRTFKMLYQPLAQGDLKTALRRVGEVSAVRRRMPGLFNRLKQER